MPKGPQGQKRPAGTVECAHAVFQIAVGEKEDSIPTGKRKSGLAGAKARKDSLSGERRTEIAALAAQERWRKK